MEISVKNLIRALRLPFITASAFPFIFGSFFADEFNATIFWLGLTAVVFAHLGANLINDYADSKSGADWRDKASYGFFGGSKLIQEGLLSEAVYFRLALFFSTIAAIALILVAILLVDLLVAILVLPVLALSWAYSVMPAALSYRRLGEAAIFILFGPVPVMGAYYMQTGIFPDLASFLVSLPFGFFTAAILYSNEIPDFTDDLSAGKKNLANLVRRERAYIGYYILSICGLLSIFLAVYLSYLPLWALVAVTALVPIVRAARIMRVYSADKRKLMESSKLAIAAHTGVSLILTGSALM